MFLDKTSQFILPKQNESVLYYLSKAISQYCAVFSAHCVNSSNEEFSNTIDFVLRGCKEDMAPCIGECVFTLRARPTVELTMN